MRVRLAHASLQFSDTDKQHTADIEKIFDRCVSRKVAWITGTEAGPGSGNTGKELLRVSKEHGYRAWVPAEQSKGNGRATDCWVAVREDLISGGWKRGFEKVIPGSQELYKDAGVDPDSTPRWGPKGLVHVSFNSEVFGSRIAVGSAHYLTGARSPKDANIKGVDHWEWNEDLANAIGDWFRKEGQGKNLAFYGGDQNMADSKNDEPQGDTFFGANVTSVQDELKKWANTGHGPIDVIATYNKDGRVKALDVVVLGDKKFFLHGDHFYVEATVEVAPLNG
jgi:hypothetical protein